MAITTTERTPHKMRQAADESLEAALRPWRRRLTLRRVVRWTGGGLLMGLLLACALLGVARLVPWATASYWAAGVALTCALLALAGALWRRPSLARSARLVDKQLKLADRLGTAWELRAEAAPLPLLQRRDALDELAKYTPRRSIRLRPGRSFLVMLGVIVLALTLLVALPNPMTAVLQQQAAFQARLAKQVTAIDHLRQTIDHQSNLPPATRQQIDKILQDTQNKLQHAQNEQQAQQILAQAQAQLNQLRNQQATNSSQARQNAAKALQNSSDPNLRAIGQALANGDQKALATALQNFAAQVSKMTPAQRAQLAQQLEQAANQAGQDPQLSAALHQLAKAVADGNPAEINQALKALQQAQAANASSQAQSQAIDQASQALQQAANQLASSNDNSSGPGQNQSQNPGQSQGPGQNQGQNQGQGPGQNPGQSQGPGNRGSGHGNNNNNTGSQPGRNEPVYVPGQISSTGSSSQSPGGDNSKVQPGDAVPYAQVVAQYSQMAHDSIDNSNIPPDEKTLVHDYFDTLEGQ